MRRRSKFHVKEGQTAKKKISICQKARDEPRKLTKKMTYATRLLKRTNLKQ
jgi:hypothetical protein